MTPLEIAQGLLLYKEGNSLRIISEKLGVSKTSLYYYLRKSVGRKQFPLKIISDDGELLGEFIGLFAGDGYACCFDDYKYRTYIAFNITEELYVQRLINDVLHKLFSKAPMVFKRKSCILICYYSKPIHQLLEKYLFWNKNIRKTYTIQLRDLVYSRDFMIGFIRGSIDSDGYISEKKISFATVSPGLKESITKCLDCLEMRYSVHLYKEKRLNRKNIYHIFISWKDREKFLEIIQPRNKRMHRPGPS